MGTTPAAAIAVFGCDQCPTFLSFRRQSDPKKAVTGLGAMGTTPAAEITVRLAGFGI